MPTPPRPRSQARTRATILAAARDRFAADGYDRATIRAVAADAGVDPALVIRYFTSKAGLFAEAADLDLALPDITDLAPAQVAAVLVSRFFEVWEADGTFLALLRAAASSETAAARMREVFAGQVAPALARAAIDRPLQRAAVVGAQVLGFAFARYVLAVPVLAQMDHDDVRDWLGPSVVRTLTDPAAGPAAPAAAGSGRRTRASGSRRPAPRGRSRRAADDRRSPPA